MSESNQHLEARTDLAIALISKEGLEPQKLSDLFAQINQAATLADLLGCVVALTENAVDLSAIFEQYEGNLTADYRKKLLTEILFALLDKLSPEILEQLFREATQIKDVRALVKFLALIQKNGIELASLNINFDPLVSVEQTKADEAYKPDEADDLSEIPVDEQGEPILEKGAELRSLDRFVEYFDKSGPLEGMKPPSSNGKFVNSPQKDSVRGTWRDRLIRHSSDSSRRKPRKPLVFSLLGEEARDLPIYEDDLKTPRERIFTAEYITANAERIGEKFPGLQVFPGNCCQFARRILGARETRSTRFDVMNLDICGTAGEFFTSGDAEILQLAGRGCELSLNVRVRQDAMDLLDALRILNSLSTIFPEITEYFLKLKEAKMQLYANERVAQNMALRDFYMAFRLVTSLESTTMPCCRDLVADLEKKLKTFVLLHILDKTTYEDILKDMHPLDQLADTFRRISDPATTKAAQAFPGWTVPLALKKMRKELATICGSVPTGEDACPQDFMETVIDSMEQEYLQNTPEAKPFSDEERKAARAFIGYFSLLSWGPMIRRYPVLIPTNIQRVTYLHDGNHTFTTWMMTLDKPEKHLSIAEAIKVTLDRLLRAQDRFINNEGHERQHTPEATRVVIPKDRILDAHGYAWNHLHPKRNVPENVLKRRRRQREIAADSRRANRGK